MGPLRGRILKHSRKQSRNNPEKPYKNLCRAGPSVQIQSQQQSGSKNSGAPILARTRDQYLHVKIDSLLVANQIRGEYQAHDDILARYHLLVMDLKAQFCELLVECIPRAQNAKANLLEKLASMKTEGQHKFVVVHTMLNTSTHMSSMEAIQISY